MSGSHRNDSSLERISLRQCHDAEQFCFQFHTLIGSSVAALVDRAIDTSAPRAILLVGDLPLQLATDMSPIELMVLVDSSAAVRTRPISDSKLELTFVTSRLENRLSITELATSQTRVPVRVTLVAAPEVASIYRSLRNRGPDLRDFEIRILGLLRSGWLLHKSEGYLDDLCEPDFGLDIYCSTRNFTFALIDRRKAAKAAELGNIALALYLGRASVEMAHLARFSSEGTPHLGPKWPARLHRTRSSSTTTVTDGSPANGIELMFPTYPCDIEQAQQYLQDVSVFLREMRAFIGRNRLFRIAFDACPQIFRYD